MWRRILRARLNVQRWWYAKQRKEKKDRGDKHKSLLSFIYFVDLKNERRLLSCLFAVPFSAVVDFFLFETSPFLYLFMSSSILFQIVLIKGLLHEFHINSSSISIDLDHLSPSRTIFVFDTYCHGSFIPSKEKQLQHPQP